MSKTDLGIFLENFDKRGSVFRGDFKKKEIFLITEVKKGKSRGGHYHTNVVNHHVLYGKIMYKEIRLTKNGKVKKNFNGVLHLIFEKKIKFLYPGCAN